MARPKGSGIQIPLSEIEKFAKAGATQAEMADRLGVSLGTIERRMRLPEFQEAVKRGRGELCISLRAKQIQVGLSGNVQMLKWLGEQYLGQAHAHRIVDEKGKDRAIINVSSPIELLNARIAGVLERKREGGGTSGSE